MTFGPSTCATSCYCVQRVVCGCGCSVAVHLAVRCARHVERVRNVTKPETVASPFEHRCCDIVDPIAPWNNLGRSVSRDGLGLIRTALLAGQRAVFGALRAVADAATRPRRVCAAARFVASVFPHTTTVFGGCTGFRQDTVRHPRAAQQHILSHLVPSPERLLEGAAKVLGQLPAEAQQQQRQRHLEQHGGVAASATPSPSSAQAQHAATTALEAALDMVTHATRVGARVTSAAATSAATSAATTVPPKDGHRHGKSSSGSRCPMHASPAFPAVSHSTSCPAPVVASSSASSSSSPPPPAGTVPACPFHRPHSRAIEKPFMKAGVPVPDPAPLANENAVVQAGPTLWECLVWLDADQLASMAASALEALGAHARVCDVSNKLRAMFWPSAEAATVRLCCCIW